jgi:hypothetical protein
MSTVKICVLFCAALLLTGSSLALFAPLTLHAAEASFEKINPNIPGSKNPSDPVDLVVGTYRFALMGAGLLAFGSILWGSIKYTTAGGNTATQGDARDQITQAFLGLGLLLGGYLILNTINPAIVSPSLFNLQGSLPGGVSAPPTGRLPGVRELDPEEISEQGAIRTEGCLRSNPALCKNASDFGYACSRPPCNADPSVFEVVQCAANAAGLPPSSITIFRTTQGRAKSTAHPRGCAADVIFTPTDCATVRAFFNAALVCKGFPPSSRPDPPGTGVLNEWVGCGGIPGNGFYSGPHIHITGCHR